MSHEPNGELNPDMAYQTVSRQSAQHGQIDIAVRLLGATDAPLIVCVHGWPESWWSWRFQMQHLAATGHRVAAIDVRGYGDSTAPPEVAAYRLTELAADTAAVIEECSIDGTAVVLGHDWGAPIAWQTARLHPGRVRGVVGMSVPYLPASAGDPMDLWEALYDGRFFYMKYFQAEGVAEAELEADLDRTLRLTYWAAAGASSNEAWNSDRAADAGFLDGLAEPPVVPEWMNAEALAPARAGLERNGMQGPLNRYRAQGLDAEELPGLADDAISVPAMFIGGENDIVRGFVEGVDLFAVADAALADCRGVVIVDEAGHWVQQEAPQAVNDALGVFLGGL